VPKLQQTKNGGYVIAIPAELVRLKKWTKGQVLAMVFNERGNIELQSV